MSSFVRIEGFHALKHALRFGAEVERACCADRGALRALAAEFAPDMATRFETAVEEVGPARFRAEAGARIPTGVLAWARRPAVDPTALWSAADPRPLVALEDPRRPGNLGAAIRAAAAADARGVLAIGGVDPWSPAAIRGGAGLQFALPVAWVAEPPEGGGPLTALSPEGDERLPSRDPGGVFLFGGERRGLSADLMARADHRLALPMREGVSSLNLATAVATVLYLSIFGKNRANFGRN